MDETTTLLPAFTEQLTMSKNSYKLGLHTLHRFYSLLSIIFSKRLSVLFACMICALSLLEQYIVYQVGMIPSGFYKVLGEKNLIEFWPQIIKSLLLILSVSFLVSCKTYVINVFYVTSRQILTEKLQFLYFSQNRFYVLNTVKYSSTDNPDQRIAQDIEKFCNKLSSVISPLIVAPFIISYYSYSCFVTTTWIGPVGIFLLFICSIIINRILMRPIMNAIIEQEKFEGFFRFKHMHVRCNAESIAFQDASTAELSRSEIHLTNLIQMQQTLYIRQFPLDNAVNLYNYIGSIVSYLILAAPIFSGKYSKLSTAELGALISKNAFVSIYLISSFSSLVDLSSALSEICGLTYRVSEILEQLNNNVNIEQKSEIEGKELREVPLPRHAMDTQKETLPGQVVFDLKRVSFSAPQNSKPLIFNLSLEISIGKNLLVTGSSGAGKTSLFRVIKGLWPIQAGTISQRLPFHPSCIFFLPQRPLLSDGTVFEQIVYPLEFLDCLSSRKDESRLIKSYLKFVDLEHILDKTGMHSKVDWQWEDVLSPGEAQRLCFVRLFYHKPRLAFLDEATSALSLESERKLYEKCKELNITVVSIGHRTSLTLYHDCSLYIDGQGDWTLSPIYN